MTQKMENVADIYPLTPTQQGMLYHMLREPESGVYFEQIRLNLEGPLNIPNLQAAWDHVVQRHAALRTIYLWEGLDSPLQVVRQKVSIPWEILDWADDRVDVEARLEKLAASYRKTGFDLAQAPLLKMALIRLEENRHHFIWNFNHLLLDGWSSHLVFDEVLATYEQLVREQQPDLSTSRPFRSFISWLKQQDLAAAEAYWRTQLKGFEEPTPLNIGETIPETAVTFAEAVAELPLEETRVLQAFAQEQRLTLNTVLQGAWALLLNRYSGQDDVLFGNTVSGRPSDLPGVEHIVGMFINTLPLRVKLPGEISLVPWLRQLQALLLEQRQFEYSPLVKIQRWSDIPAGQPLFDSIVVFENYPRAPEDARRTIKVRDKYYREQSNYPLALLVLPRERLRLRLIYDDNRFDAGTIERLLDHLQTILKKMIAAPTQRLGKISMLTGSERQLLLETWNDTAVPVEPQQCLHEFVSEHAAAAPQSPAVIAPEGLLTYAELNARSNQLADLLLAQGVTTGTPVGLYVERSTAMIVGIIGILKAGGAYVPLDPSYPDQRITFILEDLDIDSIVTQVHLAKELPASGKRIIQLDSSFETLAKGPVNEPKVSVSLDDLAYIIYTSGSTGRPKGVMVTHGNLLASTLARFDYYADRPDRYLLLSSFAFDSSVAGIFWTLAHGGALVLPGPGKEKDIIQLAALIHQERVTHTLALPSLYRLLLDDAPARSLNSLRAVIVAGEACPADLAQYHYDILPRCALFNEYGPTEATVWCSVYRLPKDSRDAVVPIGRPVANTRLYILDKQMQPLPVGVPGELYVAGAGVTPGYWQNATKTAERFVTVTIDGTAESQRLYRTGDRVRWRNDGEIEYLGRTDNQIKIRGYRIEPGEIEKVLLQHAEVQDCAVLSLPSGQRQRLTAFIANGAGAPQNEAALRRSIQAQLPLFMMPDLFVFIGELPRTPNGKVDRQAILAMDLSYQPQLAADEQVLPRTPAEEKLAAIWADVLEVEQVGVTDKFFELGGDSIQAIRVVSRARQEGLTITPRQLYAEQTIESLAADMETSANDGVLVRYRTQGSKLPIFWAPGVLGESPGLEQFLSYFDEERPFYGFRSVGLLPGCEPDQSMEKMAARFVANIRQVQPTGPYHLMGYCYGGVVAYEMAYQLEQAGEQIAFLGIVEGFAAAQFRDNVPLYHPQRWRTIMRSLPSWVRGYKEFGGWQLRQRLRRSRSERRNLPSQQRDYFVVPEEELEPLNGQDQLSAASRSELHRKQIENNRNLLHPYTQKPIKGRVTLFQARTARLSTLYKPYDPQYGWGNLAGGGVDVRVVNGSHITLGGEQNYTRLVVEMQSALDESGV